MNRRNFLKYLTLSSIGIILYPDIIGQNLEEKKKKEKEILEDKLIDSYNEIKNKFEIKNNNYTILIDGENQKLYLTSNNKNDFKVHKTYNISTAKIGFGFKAQSCKTPTGIFQINKMYGDNLELGTIFSSKQNINVVAKILYKKPVKYHSTYMTSRLICLDGLDEDNKNTSSRCIYIHGTNKEYTIGTPNSHGCIRMKNSDIIELYNLINEGVYVNIKEKL